MEFDAYCLFSSRLPNPRRFDCGPDAHCVHRVLYAQRVDTEISATRGWQVWSRKSKSKSLKISAMSGAPITVTKKDVRRGAWHYLKPSLMIVTSFLVVYALSFGPVSWLWLKLGLHKHPTEDRIKRI